MNGDPLRLSLDHASTVEKEADDRWAVTYRCGCHETFYLSSVGKRGRVMEACGTPSCFLRRLSASGQEGSPS